MYLVKWICEKCPKNAKPLATAISARMFHSANGRAQFCIKHRHFVHATFTKVKGGIVYLYVKKQKDDRILIKHKKEAEE